MAIRIIKKKNRNWNSIDYKVIKFTFSVPKGENYDRLLKKNI